MPAGGGPSDTAWRGEAARFSWRSLASIAEMLRAANYAEVGVTRVVALAKDSWREASFRGHRVEHYYEYSFRIFAVAKLRID